MHRIKSSSSRTSSIIEKKRAPPATTMIQTNEAGHENKENTLSVASQGVLIIVCDMLNSTLTSHALAESLELCQRTNNLLKESNDATGSKLRVLSV